MTPEFVIVFMIVSFFVIVGFDLYLSLDKKEGNTYSEILSKAGRKWMPIIILISFAMGLLAGHWWWPVS